MREERYADAASKSDRIRESEKSESVPRGRREEREGRARTRRRGSPIMTRERQREGVTEEGVGTQSKKSGGALRSTEMKQTARSEDRFGNLVIY